ncbi:hypothetical protein IV102_25770 [bacterium]|nr:hypothetical protein [bacterium]
MLAWCDQEGLHVSLNPTADLPEGASLPPLADDDCWSGYVSAGSQVHSRAMLPRLLRGIGHHLAAKLLSGPKDEQDELADLFVTSVFGCLAAYEADRVMLDHPIVMAAELLIRKDDSDEEGA